MSFRVQGDVLGGGRIRQLRISRGSIRLRYAEVLTLWQDDETFRSCFISVLSDSPFSAYRWETPPVTSTTVNRDFEFVLLDTPGLATVPDTIAFAEHFTTASEERGVVSFENLGRDALLVVPSPRGPAAAYGHLAAFTRQAPTSQNHALWREVGRAMQQRLTEDPVWLSTAGMGVSWLHVRLDSYPKYYGFAPYKAATGPS